MQFFLYFKDISLNLMCDRAYIKKKGRNNVTVDDLVHLITPKGRGKYLFNFLLFLLQLSAFVG